MALGAGAGLRWRRSFLTRHNAVTLLPLGLIVLLAGAGGAQIASANEGAEPDTEIAIAFAMRACS